MKPLVGFADPEVATKDLLKRLLPSRPEPCATGAAVGLSLPAEWDPRSPTVAPFVQVAWDGTPLQLSVARQFATVRVTVWHRNTTNAKNLAGLCQALLLADHTGGDITGYAFLTGPQPATDPDNDADIASFTVRAVVRGHLLPT